MARPVAASAYNWLGQYSSSPGNRTRRFFLSGGRNRLQYSLCLPTEGWPGWVGLSGLVKYQDGILANGQSPIPVLTGPDVQQLRRLKLARYHWAKQPLNRLSTVTSKYVYDVNGSQVDHLRIKVDGDEVGFFVTNDERLCEVEAARLVDTFNPALVDLLLKATAATNQTTLVLSSPHT